MEPTEQRGLLGRLWDLVLRAYAWVASKVRRGGATE